ncbi:hypothetical protein [Rhizobium sp. BK176]|uniref:DUF6630 family protein n=1 Tax=Rhizobium sp. BK176 TaxID=2587071 RepID=UPI002167412E|nr:hypothetical protein [Rhizobium sp. BK176]MCS4089198.1 hypothetical protein [Rhizobium sp. BK176]
MTKTDFIFTREHALALINEVSGGSEVALRIATHAFAGTIPDGDAFDDLNVFNNAGIPAIVVGALGETDRAWYLDWADSVSECVETFSCLLGAVGVDTSSAVAAAARLPKQIERGEAAGMVYVAFREAAEAAGYRIIDINEGSDTYCLAIVPTSVAERWLWVKMGAEHGYIGDADHQFKNALKAAGLTPRPTPDEGRMPPNLAAV